MFATFTDILCSGGHINLSSASAIGQMQYNKDMVCCHECFVTGKKAKTDSNNPIKLGMFHLLPLELQDSLLSMCKKGSCHARKEFDEALQCQKACRAEKTKLIEKEKLEKAEEKYIDAYYNFQQFNSPRCWMTIEQATEEYHKLKTKKDKLSYVKEQIQMHHLCFGWESAHSWSSTSHIYDADELFAHLVGTVIPMQLAEHIPIKPPAQILKHTNDLNLGIKSAAVVELKGKRSGLEDGKRDK